MPSDSLRTRLVAVLAERTAARVRAEAERAAPLCDLLEVRLDWLEEEADVAALFRGLPRAAVATCRRAEDGGRWKGTEERRLRLLGEAVQAGASFVDLECGTPIPKGADGATIIRSLHVPEGSEESPAGVLDRLERETGDLLKLVAPAADAPDALAVLGLLKVRPPGARPLTALASGASGTVTRLLQPVLGGALVYGSSRRGREVLAWIPTLSDLEEIYDLRSLRRGTPFYALLGRALRHSVSPHIVNALFRETGTDAVFVPVPCEDGEATARGLLDLGAAGLAFTTPFKGIPVALATLREAVAAQAGVANTLYRQRGTLVAANTDGPAIRRLAREALGSLPNRVVVVLGNGGVARAAAAALAEERCSVHLVGRDAVRTAEAAAATGARTGLPERGEVDLLINATPVGQWPDPPRDPAADLVPGLRAKVRFDAVYNPRETEFLACLGARRIRGVDMLVAQAVDQLRFFGVPKPDPALMLRAAEAALDRMERQVLLVGMRGAGKTRVGEALAAATGRPLLDTDRMVEEAAGKTVAAVFAEEGEESFRARERRAVGEALRRAGTVVALGGGAVGHLEAPLPSARVVWIRARPETLLLRLSAGGRPSLLGKTPEEEIRVLLADREPLYRSLSTLVVDTDDLRPDEAAADIAAAMGL